MDPRFGEIYDSLYRNGRLGPVFAKASPDGYVDENIVRAAIDEASAAVGRGGKKLRSDAKYWLLVNMMLMIIAPVALRNLNIRALREYDLRSIVEHDISLIVFDAADRAKSRVISAHNLVDALTRNWQRLASADLRIWERDD